MSDRRPRLIEIQVLDNTNRRISDAKLTLFSNNNVRAVINSTPSNKDSYFMVPHSDNNIRIDLEYPSAHPCYANTIPLDSQQNVWRFTIPNKFLNFKTFIGCSTEGHNAARLLQLELRHHINPVIWWQGFFELSYGTLETLIKHAHSYTHAILVLTPDDILLHRGHEVNSARDNVLFEAGFFMGIFGRDRTYLVVEKSVRLPTNLAGITIADFEQDTGVTSQADMGPAATKILQAMDLL